MERDLPEIPTGIPSISMEYDAPALAVAVDLAEARTPESLEALARSLAPEADPELEGETACEEPGMPETALESARSEFDESPRDDSVLVTAIRDGLIRGGSDLLISEALDLKPGKYRRLKRRLYEAEADQFQGKSAEDQFSDYRLDQERCLSELSDMVTHFKGTKQFNAMVGAVRAKSAIFDAIHKTGVSMGVIQKGASWDREIAGARVADMSNDDLRAGVAKELRSLQAFIDKFEDKPIEGARAASAMADPAVARVKS